ncbi:hypothetical protein AWE51_02895 [Aquimarina aggregata]|uniref:Uncharacterized protein n=1 Tax=Aquimarina aggregata TaxID=1642818 RepID=A0A163CH57_9FLAO|nr:hypothetical protein [Aquimarina aggregata]KZS42406.1 hypothetical protein AWE51_02895 [Aquimarina aggregata]
MKINKIIPSIYTPEIRSLFTIPRIYRFRSYDEAISKLMFFKNKFETSNPNTIFYNIENELILWVRDYNIENLKEQGYYGNYIKLGVKKLKLGKFYYYDIYHENVEIPIENHPRKNLSTGKHPNWHHRVLKRITKEFEYESEKDAEIDLLKLFNDHPDSGNFFSSGRLRIFVYKSDYKPKKIKSFLFDIEHKSNGKYQIIFRENNYKKISAHKIYNYGFKII